MTNPPLPDPTDLYRSALPRVQLHNPDAETLAPTAGPSSTALPYEHRLRDPNVRIRLDDEIARGGMGAVLRGRDTDLGRDIAVKVLLETHAGKAEMVQRFVEEAQISGQLQHPGVVPVYELGRFADHRPYFTMKLVKGKTLADLLAARTDPSEERARFVGIFAQICQTIAYAHARGVIHRDLKPSNMMVGAFGEVQVMDWGLAKVLQEGGAPAAAKPPPRPDQSVIRTQRSAGSETPEGSSYTQAGAVLGTPAYMAPEQAGGQVEQVDERSDVFGLGAILCEILTGKPPYVARSSEQVQYMAVMGDLGGALERLAGCGADAELVNLALRCLSVEPTERPRDASKVAEAVTGYQHSVEERLHRAELERAAEQVRAAEEAKQRVLSDRLAAAAQAQATAERRRQRLTMALAGAVLAIIILGGGAVVWYVQDRQARQARQELALHEVELLRDQAAEAKEGAPAKWQQAQSAVEKASGVVGSTNGPAQDRLAQLRDAVTTGLKLAQADEQLRARLDQIRSTLEGKPANEAYIDAFAAAGLDLNDPDAVALRLNARPLVRAALVEALDAWSVVRGEQAGDEGLKRVLKAAHVLDRDDPWRNQLRGALEKRELEDFRNLSERTEVLAQQRPVSLWLLGHSLEKLGEYDRALSVLRLGQRKYPDDYWLNVELGVALLGARRTGSGTDANAVLLQGDSEKYQAAEPYLTAAVALRPRFAPAHVMLAVALGGQGKYDEAIAIVRQAIALEPKYSMAHNDLGLYLMKKGALGAGLPEVRLALDLDPKNRDARQNLCYILRLTGKAEEAARIQREYLAHDPQDAGAYNALGDALLAENKPDEAADAYRQATRLEPKMAWPHSNLGVALQFLGNMDEAIDEHHLAIAQEPRIAEFHRRLADTLLAHGDRDGMIAEYRRSIALAPKDAWAHYNFGNLLLHEGEQQQAIGEFRQAIALDPKVFWFHFQQGYCLQQQGKFSEAAVTFQQALALEPKNAVGLWGLGDALRAQGNVSGALAAFRQSVDAQANSGWLSTELARTQAMVAVETKLDAFLKGEFEPATIDEKIGLAGLCQMKSRYRTAARLYADALAADPKLTADPDSAHRFFAAECAAMAGAGAGEDGSESSDKERADWRQKARDWLRIGLVAYTQRLKNGSFVDRLTVQNSLGHWRTDRALAPIRDKDPPGKLSTEERQACEKLWAEVEKVRRKAEGAK